MSGEYRFGNVVGVDPLVVQFLGESTQIADPVALCRVMVGDTVWCQFEGTQLFVKGVFDDGKRNFLAQAQRNLRGGGVRVATTTGVSWAQNPIILAGAGRGPTTALDGYFYIGNPPSGTVIPVVGTYTQSSATVQTDGIVPLTLYQSLYYQLPLGGFGSSVPSNFVIVDYRAGTVDIPAYWIFVVGRDDDSQTYTWGDGMQTAWWQPLPLSNGWVNYTSIYSVAQYKRENNHVYIQGLVKSGTTSGIGTLPQGYWPSGALIKPGTYNGGFVRLNALSNGVISCDAAAYNATFLSIDMDFPAEQ